MSDKTSTEFLRQLLDKRGVRWEPCSKADIDNQTFCRGYTFTEFFDGLMVTGLTPEQAVEAALGRETCKFEYTLADNGWADHTCSECGYVENLDVHVGLGWHYCPNCGREVEE